MAYFFRLIVLYLAVSSSAFAAYSYNVSGFPVSSTQAGACLNWNQFGVYDAGLNLCTKAQEWYVGAFPHSLTQSGGCSNWAAGSGYGVEFVPPETCKLSTNWTQPLLTTGATTAPLIVTGTPDPPPPPPPCVAGPAGTQTYSKGWAPVGQSVYGGFLDGACAGGVGTGGAGCWMDFYPQAGSPDGPIVNGQREWFMTATANFTGATCVPGTGNTAPTGSAPPGCDGQMGTVNGVQVCIPGETTLSKDQRAKDAAAAAAALASALATSSGANAATAAAAAAAAGGAAYDNIMTGGTTTSAAAAGAGAGSSIIGGGTTTDAKATSAGISAGAAATAAATAAGLSPALVQAAADAATAAAAAAINAGLSSGAAAAAGSTAGAAAAGGADAGTAAAAGAGTAAGTGSGTPQDQLATICESNPELSICKVGSFSGSCGSAPACSGDAVLCAVAKATFEMECSLSPEPITGAEVDRYNTAKGVTGDQSAGLSNNPGAVDVGPGGFDSTNLLGGGSGMQDVSFSVSGQSFTWHLSEYNIWLERLGLLLQAVTALVCAYIVTGSRQGSA